MIKPMKVSIITITYNAAQWLERTMRSVLAQTNTDYEYIIDAKSGEILHSEVDPY